ncbi:hypothetical protein [Helicobacter marmotae]|nr:hypothetical protein [Helicobacter marmotae]
MQEFTLCEARHTFKKDLIDKRSLAISQALGGLQNSLLQTKILNQ